MAQQESSPLVKMHTGKIAADERENRKDEKKPQVDAQIPKMLPSHDLVSGAPVSTASKREESPQKSCTEEKRDKSKEDPHGGSQEEDTEGQLRTIVASFVLSSEHNIRLYNTVQKFGVGKVHSPSSDLCNFFSSS